MRYSMNMDGELRIQFEAARRELDQGASISDAIGGRDELRRALQRASSRAEDGHHGALSDIGLSSVNPGAGDRLADYIIHLAGKRKLMFFSAAVFVALLPALLAHFENGLVNPSLSPDLLHDVGYWNSFLAATTALVLMLSNYLGRLPRVLFDLSVSGTFPLTLEEWSEFCKEATLTYSRRLFVVLPWLFAAAMVVSALHHFVLGSAGSWHHHDGYEATPSALVHLVPVFLMYYLMGLLLVRVVSTFLVLKRLFARRVNVQPLHPDRCGGLAPLGSLSLGLNAGTFLFGIIVAVGIYSNVNAHVGMNLFDPRNVIMAVGYLIGAAVLFFLPLFSAHRRMLDARYETLRDINAEFAPANTEVIARLRETHEVDSGEVERLGRLRTLHEIAASMPIYPFDVTTLLAFFGTILAPLAIWMIQECISHFIGG